jgi:Flp pilus assembly protein TadG
MTSTPADDRGAGTLGTASALLVFLLLMFAAVQILFNLYATSQVTAAAHDAARAVAGFDAGADRCLAVADAERRFVERLGAYGERGRAQLEWTCDRADVVRVRVVATHPTILPPRLRGLSALQGVDRTIEVAIEAAR